MPNAERAPSTPAADHVDAERKLMRKRRLARTRFLCELAAHVAAGYTANPECSGDTTRVARWSVEVARKIITEAWQQIRDDELAEFIEP